MAAAASRGLSAAGEVAQLRDVVAPQLSVATIKPRVVAADYAVRGEIVRRAQLLEEELQAGKRQFPFEKVSSESWSLCAAAAGGAMFGDQAELLLRINKRLVTAHRR
eukprot:GHRQ01040325.1.p1 GENE.GHRQ01040325.1~~GHRQ01040325.1.p1  ORF type:complete len:107 (+),score=36.61 GHRQ01040325.1:73-393(+)